MALYLFAVTLFLSAFALFLVQPIIGKLILPKLGGTPQVWNTCMVFFQMVLLAGYAYTHASSTKLTLRRQLIVHSLLLFLPLLVLLGFGQPFNIREMFTPPYGSNPIPATLGILLIVVGLPFFVVSTTAPLLQRWFAYTGHPASKDPYFLYGASNLGSLLALIIYPLIVEPMWVLSTQAWIWTVLYGLFLISVLICAIAVWKPAVKMAGSGAPLSPQPNPPEPTPPVGDAPQATTAVASGPPPASAAAKSTAFKKGPKPMGKHGAAPGDVSILRDDPVTPARRLRWILWAAVPSSLMLGVTAHITVDLSPIPLFWVVPLALYLLSFVLVFSKWPVVWTEGPHIQVLYIQPVAIALSILMSMGGWPMEVTIFINVAAFFITALMCHGELAKDRPSAQHLTEFYLMMSVGGMLGGMFNALIAPVLFPGLWEFPIAMVAACLVRPVLKDGGWVDDFVSGQIDKSDAHAAKPKKGAKPGEAAQVAGTKSNIHAVMDVLLPVGILILSAVAVFTLADRRGGVTPPMVMFGIGLPLLISCFFYGRPLRLGLAVGAVLLVKAYFEGRGATLHRSRSYFGIILVHEQQSSSDPAPYATLMHGTTNHGMNFRKPAPKDYGKPDKDFSRLATTYYHRFGPVGRIMEKWNWAPGRPAGTQNIFYADARMPAAMVGQSAPISGFGGLSGTLANLWSEPPMATIGLGTGTMASYCRPFQHCHFYEIDNHIRKLSLPERGDDPIFTYLADAKKRGGKLYVYMGDAFQRMRQPYINPEQDQESLTGQNKGGGPKNFYKMMVVDAFNSDAIPVHLLTKQAFETYFDSLTPDGILCVHTSNRHVSLEKVVADLSKEMGLVCRLGNDRVDEKDKALGHYLSSWVMVARHADHLKFLDENVSGVPYRIRWSTPIPSEDGRYAWTLDHSNLLGVWRGGKREEE